MHFRKKYEICGGKKNMFPKKMVAFRRKLKKKTDYKKEKEEAEVQSITSDWT